MKNPFRLDYERLADALIERKLLERETVVLVMQQANTQGSVFTEILVTEGFVSDWEVSRVAAEVFNLPFLPVEVTPPNRGLLEGLNVQYLRMHNLVPIERFGDVLTVAMPGVVPTHVLKGVSTSETTVVLPVVGLTLSNRAWLDEHAPETAAGAAAEGFSAKAEDDTGWLDIFDAGEEAVQLNLTEGYDSLDTVDPPQPRKPRFESLEFDV